MATSINKTVLLALAALSALATAACSTVAGAGRDISTAGEVVTETAEDTADDLND